MYKKRIHNSYGFQWTLLKDGDPLDLTGKDLIIVMRSDLDAVQMEHLIVEGNVISWTWPGTAQKFCGKYDAVLIEDKDTAGMAVIDTEAAIELVAHTWEESDPAPSTIELQTVVSLVPGPQGVGIDRIVYNQNYTLTIYLTDGSHYTTGNIRGEKGDEPVITADAEGNIYVDGELLTSIIKVVAELATSAAADASAKAAQASAAATSANSAASSAGTAATNANTKAALAEAAAGTASTAAAGADAKAALAQAAADNANAKAALAATAAGTANTAAAGADTSAANADAKATLADNAATSATSAAASASGAAATAVEKAALADTAAATANAAAEAADEAREGIQDDLARKANIDGYYEQMAVGLAKAIEGVTPVTESFMERTTGGDAEVANGLAQMVEVAGRSQQWNQLISNGDFSDGTTGWSPVGTDTQFSVSGGVATITRPAATENRTGYILRQMPYVSGHKYLFVALMKSNNATTQVAVYPTNSGSDGYSNFTVCPDWTLISYIWTRTGTDSRMGLRGRNNLDNTQNVDFSAKFAYCIDLTLLGIDNLTTVDEVKAWLAKNIGARPYYPFNEGTVLNNKMTGLESLGRNLLDPTTGKARIVGAYSDVYDNYYKIIGTHGALTFTSDWGEERVITPDANGEFRLLESGWLTVATPGADCSVFLWYDGTKTDYSEYTRDVAGLDLFHIWGKLNGAGELVRIWPDGQAGINDIKDVLRVENGETVARKRIGSVDMGTLTYTYDSTRSRFLSTANLGTLGIKPGMNALCSKYVIGTSVTATTPDKQVSVNAASASSYVAAKDSAYTDAATFKAAMNGVPLYFELATEQLYTDLVYQGSSLFADGTPVALPVNYNVDNWSIERIIPQNDTAVVTAVPEISCKYSIDIVETTNTQGDEIDDLYETKAGKEGSYPNMSVGSAKTLEGDDSKVEDFTFTPIQGAEGLAKLNGVRGNSLAFNQLCKLKASSASTTINGITVVDNRDGSFTVSTTSEGATADTNFNAVTMGFVLGHKYFMRGCPSGGSASTFMLRVTTTYASGGAADVGGGIIFAAITNVGSVNIPQIRVINGTVITTPITFWPQVTDLTLMFGIGKEPATVEEFVKFYPNLYYAQNNGTTLNNKTEQVVSEGFNQWDEEWEAGSISTSTGADVTSSNAIRSKNYYPIVQGATYYIGLSTRISATSSYVYFYDGAKNYLGYLSRKNTTFTPPAGAAYFRIRVGDSVNPVTTYQNDVCVNLSDTSRNGTYEPYKKSVAELGLTTLTGKLNGEGASVTVFPDGLRKAGTAYDEAAGSRAVKRLVEVDMGDLNWSLQTTFTHTFSTVISDKRAVIGDGESNLVCSKYEVIDRTGYTAIEALDKAIMEVNTSGSTNQRVTVSDTAYTDAATFKAAMAGVKLIYELAEPKEYVLDTPIPEGIQAYKGGTLKQLPENGSVPTTAPCVLSVTYPLDAPGILTGLPKDYISKESLTAMLAAMQSAGIFASYTMTWDETNGRYAFTFTPNSNE